MNKTCPECNKKTIKTGTGIVLTSYPPLYPQKWWCGCGYEEPAETLTSKTKEQTRQEEWMEINK